MTDRRHRRHNPRQPRREEARRWGPTEEQIVKAIGHIETLELPGTPTVRHVEVLNDGPGIPLSIGTRRVTTAKITRGDPMHGAKRSNDHIGRFEIIAPLADIDPGEDYENGEIPNSCPECGSATGRYEYDAYHYIAGSEAVTCINGHAIMAEEWG